MSGSDKFFQNLSSSFELYQAALKELQDKHFQNPADLVDASEIIKSIQGVLAEVSSDPLLMSHLQVEYLTNTLKLIDYALKKIRSENADAPFAEHAKDRRFKHPGWSQQLVFDLMKQIYLMNVGFVKNVIYAPNSLDHKTKDRLFFFANQVMNALSPTNSPLTNPEVIEETLKTNGANFVKGMQNLSHDVHSSNKIFDIERTNEQGFELGKTIACTAGDVIYKNDLIELIYYAPKREKSYEIPLLIIPPWINKYYILDLSPNNSLVSAILEQDIPVFLVSWINPDATYRDKTFDNYLKEGVLDVLDFLKTKLGVDKVNVLGYCIGGTLATILTSYLDSKVVNSLTCLATLLDFSEPGDIGAFIDEPSIQKLEKHMEERGYLDEKIIGFTFSMLRSNEMFWSFMINNYMLGKEPIVFDILHWNSDSTRLPYKMHSFYLRNMYLNNLLIVPNGINLCDRSIDLNNITVPTYFFSTQEDHIAPWHSTYTSALYLTKSNVRFVLGGSGHVVGVINPPEKNKYQYYTNDSKALPRTHGEWLASATKYDGSWWGDWMNWLTKLSGKAVDKKLVTDSVVNELSIEKAPGSYVRMK